MRATTSSGSSTHSAVRPRQNSPGWMTKPSCSLAVTCSVSPSGGPALRSIAAALWLLNTRKLSPRRRSMDAGWTSDASNGLTTIRPSSTRRRIVPSESTEAGTAGRLLMQLAPAARGRHRADPRGRVASRAPHTGPPRRGGRGLRGRGCGRRGSFGPPSRGDVVGVRGLVDRPPDDPAGGRRSAASGTRTGTASSSPRIRMVRPCTASVRQGARASRRAAAPARRRRP